MPTLLPSFAALPGSPAPGSVSAPGSLAISAGFGAMLAGLTPAPVKPATTALPDLLAIADRQDGADTGKILPVDPLLAGLADLADDTTADPDEQDAAAPGGTLAAWPPVPLILPHMPTPPAAIAAAPPPLPDEDARRTPAPTPLAKDAASIASTVAAMTTTPIAGSMPVQPAATAVPAQGEAVATITDAATPTPARPTAMPLPQPAAGPVPVIASTTAAKPQPALTPSAQAAPRMDPDPVAAPQPVPAPPLRAEPVPAAQLFIGQIATALDDRAQRSGARLVDLAVDLSAAGNTGNSRTELPGIAVTAPMAADQGRLDMERREWMTSMIDRIETLRTDGRQDVRIRLSPDALGSIDIRITDRGGIADVQVTAEQANARAMLAEAAPRLNELAESRGLRLNAQFDGSDRQAPGRPPHQPDQDAPSRPRPASSVSTTADAEARPDERIA